MVIPVLRPTAPRGRGGRALKRDLLHYNCQEKVNTDFRATAGANLYLQWSQAIKRRRCNYLRIRCSGPRPIR